MEEKKIFSLFQEIINNLSSYYNDTVEKEFAKYGLTARDFYLGVMRAKCYDPDPISAQRLQIRGPYASHTYYEKVLNGVKAAGILEDALEGGYILSQQGHILFRRIIAEIYQKMEQANALRLAELDELKILLARIVQASLLSDEQPRKWAILHSRRMDPGHNVSPIVSIDQYLTDLMAYRDDVHLQSWVHHDISAHAWEMFSLIWQGEVNTLEELLIKIERRMFPNKETLSSINDLIRKGWLEKGNQPKLTEKGREIRETAEALTDQYFFTPWHVLSKKEIERLGEFLSALSAALATK
jgi:hypothetical protein